MKPADYRRRDLALGLALEVLRRQDTPAGHGAGPLARLNPLGVPTLHAASPGTSVGALAGGGA